MELEPRGKRVTLEEIGLFAKDVILEPSRSHLRSHAITLGPTEERKRKLNAILAQVVEEAPAALNAFADSVGATVVRRPIEDVIAEAEAQQAAAEAAVLAAREAMREQKKQELREKWEERIENLQAKFHPDDK